MLPIYILCAVGYHLKLKVCFSFLYSFLGGLPSPSAVIIHSVTTCLQLSHREEVD